MSGASTDVPRTAAAVLAQLWRDLVEIITTDDIDATIRRLDAEADVRIAELRRTLEEQRERPATGRVSATPRAAIETLVEATADLTAPRACARNCDRNAHSQAGLVHHGEQVAPMIRRRHHASSPIGRPHYPKPKPLWSFWRDDLPWLAKGVATVIFSVLARHWIFSFFQHH